MGHRHIIRTLTELARTFCYPDLKLDADWEVLQTGSSDHYPVRSIFDKLTDNYESSRTFWKLKSADWNTFTSLISKDVPAANIDDDLNEKCVHITNHI